MNRIESNESKQTRTKINNTSSICGLTDRRFRAQLFYDVCHTHLPPRQKCLHSDWQYQKYHRFGLLCAKVVTKKKGAPGKSGATSQGIFFYLTYLFVISITVSTHTTIIVIMEGQGYEHYHPHYGFSYYYPEQSYAGQGQGPPTQYLRGYVVPEWQEQNAMLLESGHHQG
jgi:hypothetical protein